MTTILIIDDDRSSRQTHRYMLEQEGYVVFEASDGKQAIELCNKQPMDIVITDIFMPEKEGIETIVELRRDFPEVKIIVISGGSEMVGDMSTTFHTAKILGVYSTFIKPVDKLELLAAIHSLLE